MKRTRLSRTKRMPGNATRLVSLATSAADASSHIEDAFWDNKLAEVIDTLLEESDEECITAALDHAYKASVPAYEILADMVESRCEGHRIEFQGQVFDALLITAPVLAWSRYSIPAGPLSAEVFTNLRTHLTAHVLAADTRLALADFLFSPDQLPDSFCHAAELARELTQAALAGQNLKVAPEGMRETMQFLSDTRYLMGVVLAPHGAPLFRWQEADGDRAQALAQWQQQGLASLLPALPACACEALLPQAYHSACRDGDRLSRPFSLKASVEFLQTTLNVPATELTAVVAPFHQQQLEEYRIGFSLKDSADVLHGVVWPLLDQEDEAADCGAQIEAALKAAGMTDVRLMDQRFPLEYCDDCGAPLYPSIDGEPVHAEMPEATEDAPRHLH